MNTTVLESVDTDNDFENQLTSSPPPLMSESPNTCTEETSEHITGPTTQPECSQSAPLLPTSEAPVPIEDSNNTENLPSLPSENVADCAGIVIYTTFHHSYFRGYVFSALESLRMYEVLALFDIISVYVYLFIYFQTL